MIVRFQNNKEKWIAFIGLYNGRPYEIFTGIADDEEGIMLPKAVTNGKIVKNTDEEGNSRYDFQFSNKRGFKTTVEGLSYKFNKEYWNYAKLISGVLRYGMPINQIVDLVARWNSIMRTSILGRMVWKEPYGNLSRTGRKQPVLFARIVVLNPLFIKRGV